HPPRSPPFPYTPRFRSGVADLRAGGLLGPVRERSARLRLRGARRDELRSAPGREEAGARAEARARDLPALPGPAGGAGLARGREREVGADRVRGFPQVGAT